VREDRRVFWNRILKKIFRPQGTAIRGDWRKLCNQEPNDLYSNPYIIMVMKSGGIILAESVACIRGMRNEKQECSKKT
jgi:hypothetical protein